MNKPYDENNIEAAKIIVILFIFLCIGAIILAIGINVGVTKFEKKAISVGAAYYDTNCVFQWRNFNNQ